MRTALPFLTAIVAVALVGCGDDVANKSTPAPATTPAADNTAKNARDDGTTLTPLDQGLGEADTNITMAIRKAVVAEPNFSMKAQNAKIITKDGVVTLRGPVATSIERNTIKNIAELTPGVKRVDNQLEVVSQ